MANADESGSLTRRRYVAGGCSLLGTGLLAGCSGDGSESADTPTATSAPSDTRPLAANDAFGNETWDGLWGSVGYETMLEADPDVILHLWGMTPRYDTAEMREQLESHNVGKRLAAVENDRVYAQGMRYQGPLMNLFQIEMTAKQLYPEIFGEWPAYEDGDHYPEIPPDEQLFDRERVAAIVTGE